MRSELHTGEEYGAGSYGAAYGYGPRFSGEPGPLTMTLGYGERWDARLRGRIESFLNAFSNIAVRAGGGTLSAHPPYYINSESTENSRRRKTLALQHRREATGSETGLPGGLQRGRGDAIVGKGSPAQYREILQGVVDGNLLRPQGTPPTAARLRAWLVHFGVGIDCSGFVSQALNILLADVLGRGLNESERLVPLMTSAASLNAAIDGGARFERVASPAQLCPGDTMGYPGHIRIVSRIEMRPDGAVTIHTAESTSRADAGPSPGVWRCPSGSSFAGLKYLGPSGTTAPRNDSGSPVTFSRYRALRDAIAARPSGPSAEAVEWAGVAFDLNQSDVSHAFVARAHARVFRNAAEIDRFFAGLTNGGAGFIDWYNNNIGRHVPFADRGRIRDRARAQSRFQAFWQTPSIRTLYDRDTVSLLEFVTLTCIAVNETGGALSGITEQCVPGKIDTDGRLHRGLAYAFDRFTWRRQNGSLKGKRSYNAQNRLGNLTAGQCFANQDFIRAHGHLGMGSRLRTGGSDGIDPRWNGVTYPADRYSTDEDHAANGFIMECDFYKFRGRGPIQVTGRGVYRRMVQVLLAWSGTNPVLNRYKSRWAAMDIEAALTTSTNADWAAIFGESEFLAMSVRSHSNGRGGYLTMSGDGAVFLSRTADLPGSASGMGRGIGGNDYVPRFRGRVMAMLNAIPITAL